MELLPINFISDLMGKVVQQVIQLLLQAAMMVTDIDLFQLSFRLGHSTEAALNILMQHFWQNQDRLLLLA